VIGVTITGSDTNPVILAVSETADAGIVYRRYGPTDVLECEELDKPIPAQGEVLIQVRAASVNPHDWHFLPGTPSFIRLFTGLRQPKSLRLGADVAGVVPAAGPGAPRFKPSDTPITVSTTQTIEVIECPTGYQMKSLEEAA
jgi:NADPH:quinone reductase-like Zn-dependent oxidoreductase